MNDVACEELLGPPLLHDRAPDFVARTTMGDRKLSDYRGKWLLFFSHPADFTPVCASEFIAFAKASERFQALGCDLLALSVDSLFSHLAWIRSIKQQFGVEITFPIIEDPSMVIARVYGMIAPRAPDSALVRAVFLIDGHGIIRAITWYPMTTGRNVGGAVAVARRAPDDRYVPSFHSRGLAPGRRRSARASAYVRKHLSEARIRGRLVLQDGPLHRGY